MQNSVNADPSNFHLNFQLAETVGSLVAYSLLSQLKQQMLFLYQLDI